jgi:hypothetical protein
LHDKLTKTTEKTVLGPVGDKSEQNCKLKAARNTIPEIHVKGTVIHGKKQRRKRINNQDYI